MRAVNPAASAKEPTFDLPYLIKGLKDKTISDEYVRVLSLGLCTSAKSILLLSIDRVNDKCGLSSDDDLMEALFASASLIELAEFVVAETENCHE